MSRSLFLFGLCISLLTGVSVQVHAQTVDVRAFYRPRHNFLGLSVNPDQAQPDCELLVYAALKRRHLSDSYVRAKRLASLPWTEDSLHVIVRQVPFFSRASRQRAKMFFRAVSSCNLEVFESDIAVLRVRLDPDNGTNLSTWFRQNLRALVLNGSFFLREVFSSLTFDKPVDLQDAPDQHDELYVVEQSGKIKVFENSNNVAAATDFLDLSDEIEFNPAGGEQGLLGLAFHPDYQQNGYFFVNYTEVTTGSTVVARYQRDPSNRLEALTTETRLLVIEQPFSNHNGGQIAIGPNGDLFVGMGDGGSGGDPLGHGQNRESYLGNMLRIDVDDPEFPVTTHSWGFRNPWRFSFDDSGRLWMGDVGQGTREEINLVQRGKNYGWNTMEASLCFSPSEGCDTSGLTLPIFEYSRDLGRSVTGGYVYSGSEQLLEDVYVFGDFLSGRVWGLLRMGRSRRYFAAQLLDSDYLISSFGKSANGDLFVLDYSGKLYRLVKS